MAVSLSQQDLDHRAAAAEVDLGVLGVGRSDVAVDEVGAAAARTGPRLAVGLRQADLVREPRIVRLQAPEQVGVEQVRLVAQPEKQPHPAPALHANGMPDSARSATSNIHSPSSASTLFPEC
jgi:hypothetical protein